MYETGLLNCEIDVSCSVYLLHHTCTVFLLPSCLLVSNGVIEKYVNLIA